VALNGSSKKTGYVLFFKSYTIVPCITDISENPLHNIEYR